MKQVFTLAVYGTFKDGDVRIKIFMSPTTEQFRFQNILVEAGYDCKLFSINDTDLEVKS